MSFIMETMERCLKIKIESLFNILKICGAENISTSDMRSYEIPGDYKGSVEIIPQSTAYPPLIVSEDVPLLANQITSLTDVVIRRLLKN